MDILDSNDLKGIVLKPNLTRAKLAIGAFGVICALDLISIASQLFAVELYKTVLVDGIYDEGELYATDTRQLIIQTIYLVVEITAIVFFLNWFRRAYGNLHKVRSFSRYSEWMAAASFFIPIISLFRPYKIAMELAAGIRYKIRDVHPQYTSAINLHIVGIWWTLWIATSVLGQFAVRKSLESETFDQYITSAQLTIISDIVDLLAAAAAIIMMRQISADEVELQNCTVAD